MARMILIDKNGGSPKLVDANGLYDYYKYLDCDCIDIAVREIGGVRFDIILDDEGLLKDDPVIMAFSQTCDRDILVGSLLLCHDDGEGNETDANERDLEIIKRAFEDTMVFDQHGLRNVLVLD